MGNRVTKTTTQGQSSYAYDQQYQLVQSITPSLPQENFSYDPIGNRVSDNNSTYVYDASKQELREDFKYLYQYDGNGNLAMKQDKNFAGNVENYEYSSENQLRRFKLYKNGSLAKDVIYTFDALGRRVEKDVVDHEDSSKSLTKRFVYDGNEILAEYDQNNSVITTYTHSMLRTDDVLAMTNSQGNYYFVKDGLGSITDITDESGFKVQHYEYTSFGKLVLIADGAGADITQNPLIDPYFTYTAREFDKESGLYYYRARMYNPEIGRFLTTDPDQGSVLSPNTFVSKYTYVANNPINLIDPSGTSVRLPDLSNAFKGIHLKLTLPEITLSKHDQIQLIQLGILVLAAYTGGVAGGAAGGGIVGAFVGGAVGGLVGGAGYSVFKVGTFKQGFIGGAIVGGVAGYIGIEGEATELLRAEAHEAYMSAYRSFGKFYASPYNYVLANPEILVGSALAVISIFCKEGKVSKDFAPNQCSF